MEKTTCNYCGIADTNPNLDFRGKHYCNVHHQARDHLWIVLGVPVLILSAGLILFLFAPDAMHTTKDSFGNIVTKIPMYVYPFSVGVLLLFTAFMVLTGKWGTKKYQS